MEIESAVVLAVKRNALQVLIPKYGLEGPIYLPAEKFKYNEEVISYYFYIHIDSLYDTSYINIDSLYALILIMG